jgi:hypothetical protein
MANNLSPNPAPGGVVDVAGPLIGRSIIDSLRRKFSPSGLVQDGDFLMDQSRDLLGRHLQLMEARDQKAIRKNFDMLVSIIYVTIYSLTLVQQCAKYQEWLGKLQRLPVPKAACSQ